MDKKRRRFLKAFSSIPAYYSVTGAVGASQDGDEVHYDDIGRRMDEEPEIVRRYPRIEIQSNVETEDDGLPDGTVYSDHEWVSGGAPNLGHDYRLRIVDRGGGAVDSNFPPSGISLTFDFWWKWQEGDQIHYFWNDDDDYRDTAFRAYTFGRAGRGMRVNNPFGGETLSTSFDPVSDGEWHRIRVVLDAQDETMTAYVDGEESDQVFYDGLGWQALPTFRVMGRMSFKHPSPPELRPDPTWGDYDNFMLTLGAVHPPDEITEPNLIWYDLEEGEGTTLQNRAGESRDRPEPEPDFERELAEKFAPDFHFDADEKWFPTDPRELVDDPQVPADSCEEDNGICGFDALNKYTKLSNSETAPNATVMYNVVGPMDLSGRLYCVSYWLYYAFNNFSFNDHFHDNEVVHFFLDVEDGEDVESTEIAAVVASAHKDWFPNNEFVPDLSEVEVDNPIGVQSELGGHASAPDIRNDGVFRRNVDLTTSTSLRRLWPIPEFEIHHAYGLPREHIQTDIDQFIATRPYSLPRLDFEPLHLNERLPAVKKENMIDADAKSRTQGNILQAEHRDPQEENTYSLVDASIVQENLDKEGIRTNIGPSLDSKIEPAVNYGTEPAGLAWEDTRFEYPMADINDVNTIEYMINNFIWHESELTMSSNLDSSPTPSKPSDLNRTKVIGEIMELGSTDFSFIDDEYSEIEDSLLEDDEIDVVPLGVPDHEVIVSLDDGKSKVAFTRGAAFTYVNIEKGEANLLAASEQYAPINEKVKIKEDEEIWAGAGEERGLALVKRENAVKIRGDGGDFDKKIVSIQVEEDFAGLIYESEPIVPNFFEIFVHHGGAYIVEVEDENGVKGVFRVNPREDNEIVAIDDLRTGKTPIIEFLVDYLEDTKELVSRLDLEGPGDSGTVPSDSSENNNGKRGHPTPPVFRVNPVDVEAPQLRGRKGSGGKAGSSASGNSASGGGPSRGGSSGDVPGRGRGGGPEKGINRGNGSRNSVLMRISAMTDSARRALDLAEDYRRYNANNQLDTLLNQLESLRNFLNTPAMNMDKKYEVVILNRLEVVEGKVELAKDTDLYFDR